MKLTPAASTHAVIDSRLCCCGPTIHPLFGMHAGSTEWSSPPPSTPPYPSSNVAPSQQSSTPHTSGSSYLTMPVFVTLVLSSSGACQCAQPYPLPFLYDFSAATVQAWETVATAQGFSSYKLLPGDIKIASGDMYTSCSPQGGRKLGGSWRHRSSSLLALSLVAMAQVA